MFRVFRVMFVLLVVLSAAASSFAQSQAVNGTIEGTIIDESGAALPGVSVTVANLDTGDTRVVVTNEAGVYRAPLLPLGRYRVVGRAPGLQEIRAAGADALGRPVRRHQRDAQRRQHDGNGHGDERVADRGARQDRPRPHDR